MQLTVLEICAGGGGQARGLEAAGFELAAAVEIDRESCNTLRSNRPAWKVIENSVTEIEGADFRGIDLFAGGVPCPPFSIAGKQLGHEDERDLFPEALRLIGEAKPKAVLLENVPGFASEKFSEYRRNLIRKFDRMGYSVQWRVLNACWFRVPQLRPRFVLVAFQKSFPESFQWPEPDREFPPTVGDVLIDLMSSRDWKGAEKWRQKARGIAPTLVGGSRKHGGPDLGPTRARKQWSVRSRYPMMYLSIRRIAVSRDLVRRMADQEADFAPARKAWGRFFSIHRMGTEDRSIQSYLQRLRRSSVGKTLIVLFVLLVTLPRLS